MHSESATVFRNVRPYGAEKPEDLTVVDGVFTGSPAPSGARVVDGEGRIAQRLMGVTVSHVFCVPGLPERELDAPAAGLAEAGISLTTVAPS